jgi:transposase
LNLTATRKKEFESDGNQAFPGKGNLSAEKDELNRLRKENKRLRMERDILKKATAFFAKESE